MNRPTLALTLVLLTLLTSSAAWGQITATTVFKEQIDTETELEGVVGDVTDIITNNDTLGGALAGNMPSPTITDDYIDYPDIFYTNTLAGNPAFGADEGWFASTATGLCIMGEGSIADTNEMLYCFPDDNEADTTRGILLDSAPQTVTNKSIDAAQLDSGTVPAARVGADHLDAMTEIATGIKRRADDVDTHLLTTSAAIPGTNRCLEIDTNGSVVVAADTCANLGPGGTPSLDQITDPVADATFAFDAGEEADFSYTGNFTTGNQFAIRQVTGNPTGGILFDVRAADADVEVARFGDGTNGVSISQAGVLTAIGTGSIVAADYVPLAGDVTVTNPLTFTEQAADESNPAEGNWLCWQSNGVGSGDDGDILCKITAGAVTKFVTLLDFSAI